METKKASKKGGTATDANNVLADSIEIQTLRQTLNDGQIISVADLPKCLTCSRHVTITQGSGINDMAIWHECEIWRRKVLVNDFCKHYEEATENMLAVNVSLKTTQYFR